jgi:hypothetical protein
MKGNAMTDNFDTTPEWEIDLTKGGPGSGPGTGHPFRGNRWTSGIFNAMHSNLRGGAQEMGPSQHLDTANGHIQAGLAAIHAGRYGEARMHLNEAAYHAGHASAKMQGGSRALHVAAKDLSVAAHHAGNMAELASKATNDVSRAMRAGVDAHTTGLLGGIAARATQDAFNSASDVSGRMAGIQASRVGNALNNVGAQVAAQGA